MTAVPLDEAAASAASSPPDPPSRRRAGRIVVAGLVTIFIVYVATASALFVWPGTDRPRAVGAVLSLNGRDEPAREKLAVSLVEKGYSSVLLFSQGHANTPCPAVPHVTVVCFPAHPDRTIGEIEFAVGYARSHGIRSILIAAGQAQVTRARLLADRCFAGQVLVVGASIPWDRVPYEVMYETGAMIKATVIDGGCS